MRSVSNVLESVQRNRNEIQFNHICFGCDVVFVCLFVVVHRLRKSIDCLDITCRMGCDYGFVLDPETKCPTCECRDPCDGAICPENYECRSVDVACEGEYCPPVPACLPKKPGQCPYLVPPGTDESDADLCQYECRSDTHCDGEKKCCSNGCGTQCKCKCSASI